MKGTPATRQEFLMRVASASVVAGAFLVIGPVILIALLIIGPAVLITLLTTFTACCGVVVGIDNSISTVAGLLRDVGWPVLTITAAMAGVAGLMAGIYEVLFVRAKVRVILIISSLVISFELLIMETAKTGSIQVTWYNFGLKAIALLWFVAGMMACWKMTDIVRGNTRPAVEVVQVFD